MTTMEVLTKEFFQNYDDLGHDASDLQGASESLKASKQAREDAQRLLATSERKLRSTRNFIREQRDRIEIVSRHWFYGTTALQPQLWFRGGCKGKIERARVKLVRAQEVDLPEIESTIQNLQLIQLPRLESEVERQFRRFELSANAASEREIMKQKAYDEYPTATLIRLQEQEEQMSRRQKDLGIEAENLEDTIATLFKARKVYKTSRVQLDNAMRLNSKVRKLKETPEEVSTPMDALRAKKGGNRTETFVANGSRVVVISNNNNNGPKDLIHLDRSGKIISTNFPCPQGCGHLVTWHETHCCGSCKRESGQHGRRCERKPLSSQLGAVEKLMKLKETRETHMVNLHRAEEHCSRSFTDGRREAKQGERLALTAIHGIAISIRERHAAVCASLTGTALPPSTPQGGAFSTELRQADIQREIEALEYREVILAQQLSTIQQLQTSIRQESQGFQADIDSLQTQVANEKTRIFDQLRARVTAAGPTAPPDSAVMELDDDIVRPPAFAPHDASPMPTTPASSTRYPSAPSEEQILVVSIDSINEQST